MVLFLVDLFFLAGVTTLFAYSSYLFRSDLLQLVIQFWQGFAWSSPR